MITTQDATSNREGKLKRPPVGVAFLVSQVGAHAADGFAERLAVLKLKPHHAGILRMLGSNPGLTQQALSELLGIFPSQLVLLLDLLEEQKLIERCNTPEDRRSYRLHLTRRGRGALAQIGHVTQQLEDDLFAVLNEREMRVLRELLTRVVKQQQITPGVHPAYKQLGRR
jgi:DNA-binding MarR family transcriptional regulator